MWFEVLWVRLRLFGIGFQRKHHMGGHPFYVVPPSPQGIAAFAWKHKEIPGNCRDMMRHGSLTEGIVDF
jgi:hypothetical protein